MGDNSSVEDIAAALAPLGLFGAEARAAAEFLATHRACFIKREGATLWLSNYNNGQSVELIACSRAAG